MKAIKFQFSDLLSWLWKGYLWVVTAEMVLACIQLATKTSSEAKAILFGYSPARMLMIGFVGILALVMGLLAVQAMVKPARFQRTMHPITGEWVARFLLPTTFGFLWLGLFLVALPGIGDHNTTLELSFERYDPIARLFILIGVQNLVWVTLRAWPRLKEIFKPVDMLRSPTWITLFLLVGVWLFLALTDIGLQKDPGSWWFGPGVPLLEYQVLLIFLLVGLIAWLSRKVATNPTWIKLDWVIAFLVWLVASVVWMNTPWVANSHFTPKPVLPNLEIYPYSDAAYYDISAQTLLIGQGYGYGSVIVRPIYSLFLAVLHLVGGQNYNTIIFLQTAVLAIFPTVLYFLGRFLGSRLAGLTAAALCILREVNTILVTHTATVSSSKLLMSDLPAALALSIISLLFFNWLKNNQDRVGAMIIGGTLGLGLLLRYQMIVLIPIILVTALVAGGFRWRQWLLGVCLFVFGIGLAITPWLVRNAANTGKFIFEEPKEVGFLAQLYSQDTSIRPRPEPNESEAEFNARVNQMILNFVVTHPDQVVLFTLKNWVNNEIATLMVLPVRFGEPTPQGQYPYLSDSFWMDSNKQLSLLNILIVFINLIFISGGIGASWNRWRWAGLAPLIIHAAYSLSCAVARTSGFRFILPADWAAYFYFAVGIAQTGAVLSKNFPNQFINSTEKMARGRGNAQKLSLVIILFLGLSLPFSEKIFPKLYPAQSRDELAATLTEAISRSQPAADLSKLTNFLNSPETIVDYGRALYPRFYYKDKGIPSTETRFAAFLIRPFDRVGFFMLGSAQYNVILPTESIPNQFPNTSKIFLAGCQQDGYLEARAVVVVDRETSVYLSKGDPFSPCSTALK